MVRLVWDKLGSRRFEAGVDHGVLYTSDGSGVPWNGLTSIKESASGGQLKSFSFDGIRYLTTATREEYDGTIEALTYPDEFAKHDGTSIMSSGLIIPQQRRKPFSLSYRTRVGNDADGAEFGYKIHLIYNIMASPSDRAYNSVGDRAEAMGFTWQISAVPKRPNSIVKVAPVAHVIIDSTKTSVAVMRYLEEQLYGSVRQNAKLLPIDSVFSLFENPQIVYVILANKATGANSLQVSVGGTGDLIGDPNTGLYNDLPETRLIATSVPGLYLLHPLNTTPVIEDTADVGTYKLSGTTVSEDSADAGTYLINEAGFKEDPADPGTYVTGI